MEERDEVEKVTNLMEQINLNLKSIGEFRKRFNDVLEAVGSRMDVLEQRIKDIPQSGATMDTAPILERLTEAEKGIGKIEEHIEKAGVKAHNHKDLEQTVNSLRDNIKTVEALAAEDNKFLGGVYTEVKEHIKTNDEKLKEISKSMAKVSKENEQANKFRLALKGFIKAVLED